MITVQIPQTIVPTSEEVYDLLNQVARRRSAVVDPLQESLKYALNHTGSHSEQTTALTAQIKSTCETFDLLTTFGKGILNLIEQKMTATILQEQVEKWLVLFHNAESVTGIQVSSGE